MGFDYAIIYKKGSENLVVDVLSHFSKKVELVAIFISTWKILKLIKSGWLDDSKI